MDLTVSRLAFAGGPGGFDYLPAGTQRPPVVTIPKAEGDKAAFLDDITDRLKWSLLESPTTAQVVELNSHGEPQWRPLFGEPDHALAGEPITQPPRSRMLVKLIIVSSWEFWQDACAQVDCPAPLLIENPDGEPITLAQFINEVHRYCAGLRDLIYEIEDREDSEHALLYCTEVSGPQRKDAGDVDSVFSIHVITDVGMTDEMFEEKWAWTKQRFAKKNGPNP